MAQSFTLSEWIRINDFLDSDNNVDLYGIPEKRDGSVVFASWNIRKFGALISKK